MSWQLADKSTPHLYNLKHLFWSWGDHAIHFCILYLNIHPIYTQLSFHINSYTPLYHHHYLCVNMVVLLVTHKTTRSWSIEISTYLAITSSPWQPWNSGPLMLLTTFFKVEFFTCQMTLLSSSSSNTCITMVIMWDIMVATDLWVALI